MICASQRNLRACAGLIGAPLSSDDARDDVPIHDDGHVRLLAALRRSGPRTEVTTESIDQPMSPAIGRRPLVRHATYRWATG